MARVSRNPLILIKKVIEDLSHFKGDFSELAVLSKEDREYAQHVLVKELTRIRFKLIHMSVMLLGGGEDFSDQPLHREISRMQVFEEPTYSRHVSTAYLASIWEMHRLPSDMLKMFVLRHVGSSFTETCDAIHALIDEMDDAANEKVRKCVVKNYVAVFKLLFMHTKHTMELDFDRENVIFTFHWNSV